jgi:hypothetical protein
MTLPIEARVRVARAADKEEGWRALDFGVGPYIGTSSGTGIWNPDFGGELWQRHQALQLVEWLARKCSNKEWLEVSRHMFDKDIPALESLVYELMEIEK